MLQEKSRMPLAGLVYLGPSSRGAFLDLYMFRVLLLLLPLVQTFVETVSPDDSSMITCEL